MKLLPDEKMMADIPILVKRLRKQLELTQAQFAWELGVACSTVKQWEIARRRPQPVLLARLREIETSLGQGSFDHLTEREARAFKQRWEAVNAAERHDLAATPVAQKFRMVEALIASARQLGWTEAPTEDKGRVCGSAGPGCAGFFLPETIVLAPLLTVHTDLMAWLKALAAPGAVIGGLVRLSLGPSPVDPGCERLGVGG
jgi:transcriptional regulator with XRE-family HTH domain